MLKEKKKMINSDDKRRAENERERRNQILKKNFVVHPCFRGLKEKERKCNGRFC